MCFIAADMIVTATIRDGSRKSQKLAEKHTATTPRRVLTRPPTPEDAASASELIRKAGTLELNTTYAYLLLCSHFAETSAVAVCGEDLVGCAFGYRIPQRPQTLFLWQIGVDASMRRQGVARRLLDELLDRSELADVKCIETTVAPSNLPSRKLFEGWAKNRQLEIESVDVLGSSLFGSEGSHEPEEILRLRREVGKS
jgi:L-2,4-diaminobutyric acid acetyltransferase